MFDSTKKFRLQTIDGKACVVRFPSDREWCDRARRNKTIRRDLGRGKSQYEPGNAKQIDLELFKAIRDVDDTGPEFDEHEAAYIINRLDSNRVVDIERSGNRYDITLRVPGATTKHAVKIPSQKQTAEFGDASGKTIHGDRATEIRVFLEPGGALYDAICLGSEGYAGEVPIVHKCAVVDYMLRDISVRMEEEDPEE